MPHQIKNPVLIILLFGLFGILLAACDSASTSSPVSQANSTVASTTTQSLATTSLATTTTVPFTTIVSTVAPPATVAATTIVPATLVPATTAPTTIAATTVVPATTNAPTPTIQTAVDTSKPRYIAAMRATKYSSQGIQLGALYEQTGQYKANLISYESDGLKISGLMYVPAGNGPFPLALVNHGYFDPSNYGPGWDTLRELRFFAANGYVTIASDYRNYGSSSKGDNTIQPGYTHDILNLIEAAKQTSYIDKNKITIMGHSMGGEITLDVLVVSRDIKVAALFGSMSASSEDNYYARRDLYHSQDTGQFAAYYGTPATNPDSYIKQSPLTYFKDINVPVEVNIGTNDTTTPPIWSQKIYDALKAAGKTTEFYTYPGEGHSLNGAAFNLAMQRTLAFFNKAIGR